MGAQAIIEMEGKKTRIVNIKVNMLNHKCSFVISLKACCNFVKLVLCGVRQNENMTVLACYMYYTN